jgi:NADPH:quinone reductase-like Zn-dependent oxidoreductase
VCRLLDCGVQDSGCARIQRVGCIVGGRRVTTKGKERYDLIMDQAGNHSPSTLRRVLTPAGRIQPNSGHGGMGYVFQSLLLSLSRRQHGKLFVAHPNREDMVALKDLIEAGKVTPVIDRTCPLSEVPEALGYAEQGHVPGKVVVTVE